MAKKSSSQSSTQAGASFSTGMQINEPAGGGAPQGNWTYARNASNNSRKGDLGKLGTEFGNVLCTIAPFTVIGAIHIVGTRWMVFSTNNYQSEIGIFDEGACTYEKLVRDACLNFQTSHLIKGVSRATFDCSYKAYFADGINPDRVVDIENIPWKQICDDSNGSLPGGCITCVDKLDADGNKILDCDKIRLESYLTYPNIKIAKGVSGGSMLNGSYHVHICYTVNGQQVSDYSTMSNVVSLWSHENINNAIEIQLDNLDTDFDDFDLVLVSTISEKTVARKIGSYSTSQSAVIIDFVDLTLPIVSLESLPILTPVPDKSEGIYENGMYALRVAPTEKFEFNYQPLANQIQSWWTCVEYTKEYYKNAGVNVGYMRDEVYPFFIRWIHNTGDKTKAYHIPGRGPVDYKVPSDAGGVAATLKENENAPGSANIIEQGYAPKVFEVYNTAWVDNTNLPVPNPVLPDGGVVIQRGRMAYHESSEFYPDKNPTVWNASAHLWSASQQPDHDLCGKQIRHHKFPENVISSGGTKNTKSNHYSDGGDKIRIMGVQFENIKPPVDNNGVRIKSIVGYEILRGSRNGNKTVLYKGLINNMFEYDLPSVVNAGKQKGMYANYPFNDLRPDPFISKAPGITEVTGKVIKLVPNDVVNRKNFTFHSPDTMFVKPFLVDDELKIYGEMWGMSKGHYKPVDEHPRHKFITNFAFTVSVIVGIGYAIGKVSGTRSTKYTSAKTDGSSIPWYELYAGFGNGAGFSIPFLSVAGAAGKAADLISQGLEGVSTVGDVFTGQNFGVASSNYVAKSVAMAAGYVAGLVPGSQQISGDLEIGYDNVDRAPGLLRAITAIPVFTNYLGEGTNSFMELIKSVSRYSQFAYQYVSVCQYENFGIPNPANIRKKLHDAKYLNPGLYDLYTPSQNYVINHIHRQETVVLTTTSNVLDPTTQDISRPPRINNLEGSAQLADNFYRASSHYVAIKNRLRNQYGQLTNIKIIPTQSFIYDVNQSKSDIVFGGDTYIGRYSEKNTLYYFQQWLKGEPDGAELNYRLHQMFEYTSYWMNTENYDFSDFTSSIGDAFKNAADRMFKSNPNAAQAFFNTLGTPSSLHVFDKNGNGEGLFTLKKAYMYLFNSGVREFFVESELNIDYRDYGEVIEKRHYPITSNLDAIFHNNIIKNDNYYKLDRSLAVSFLPFAKVPWSTIQELKYNPLLYASCYTKRIRRVLYSLPQQTETKKDNWSVFLPYDYKDFDSEVTAIKPIDKTAALILFKNSAPGLLPGVDTLQTGSGTKLQIGDGNLFARELQRLSNSERSYEYGSCQSRLSVINTPTGLYWMCLNQGKLFQYAGGIKELSLNHNEFWINQYLPYKLKEDFPNFDIDDNPVAGIGCQTIYDNEYGIVYFCKKDYSLKDEFKGPNPLMTVEYKGDGIFLIGGMFETHVGNPMYFNNASWTISYDPMINHFVSFHDWHPDLAMSGKNTFITTKVNGFWRHNKSVTNYCNYYGDSYPFEVEFELDLKLEVTTLRSIEYYIEASIYDKNEYDKYLLLDRNFDEAVIYNAEQISGTLKLNLNPKNDLSDMLSYPKVNFNSIDILYSKEEQKYRFNQFWDIVKDRGEYSNVKETIWKTEDNGYIRSINPNSINYQKSEFERKKFRNNVHRVILRRMENDNVEMLVNIAYADMLQSLR